MVIVINKKYQNEIVSCLQLGYSIPSICKVMSKKYKGVEFKSSDIIILAKQRNIQVGKKDLSKEKIDFKTAEKMLPTILEDSAMMGKIKKSILIIILCFVVLMGVIWYLAGIKPMLITLAICAVVFGGIFAYIYFTYVRNGKSAQSVKKKLKNK